MNASERNTPHPSGDPTIETAYMQYDWEGDDDLSTAIVSTVARLSDTDPVNVGRIFDRIDPDALDRLFEPAREDLDRNDGHLWFPLDGYGVTVYGNGFVVVRRLE